MFTGPLEDRMAISELNGVYADGVVRFDPDTWGATWAEDADWDLMGHKTKGREAIVGFWNGAMGGLEAVSFQCVPCMIEVTGDTAISRVQTQEILQPKEGPARHIGGLYEDTLAKVDGRWVFSSRTFRIIAEFGAQG